VFTLHRPLSPLADARLGSLHAVFAPWVQLCAAAPFCCARHIASILEDLSLLTLLFCNVRPSEQRSDLCVGHAPADGPRDASGSPSSMRGTSASYNSHATEDGQDPRHEVTVAEHQKWTTVPSCCRSRLSSVAGQSSARMLLTMPAAQPPQPHTWQGICQPRLISL
jgi:hypothetical protein